MRSRRLAVLLFAAVLVLPLPAAAQLTPLSDVFVVRVPSLEPANSQTSAFRPYNARPDFPFTAPVRQGFVVGSFGSTDLLDTLLDGVLVDRSGQPGPKFLAEFISNSSDITRRDPAIATSGPGGFVMVWALYHEGIYHYRYEPGVPPGQTVMTSVDEGFFCATTVAGNAAGAFAAAWEGDGCYGGHPKILVARAFYPSGAAATEERIIIGNGKFGQPRIGIDAAGRFVVAWRQSGATGGAPAQLCAQAYGVRGGFLGGTYCIGDLAGTTAGVLAVDPAGKFFAAWFAPAAAGAPSPLFVRRYELDGTPLGDAVQVGAAANPAQLAASADGQGNAALSWREGNLLRILLVSREGVAKGPVLTLSGIPGRPDYANGVALEDSGRLLVTWLSGVVQLGQLWQAHF